VQWRIAGRGGAAEQLGLKPSTLRSRMEKLGLKRGLAREGR
jgi:formate hydrogenlyase transcriptional activator